MITKTFLVEVILFLNISAFYINGQEKYSHSKDGISHKWVKDNGNYIALLSESTNTVDFNYFSGNDIANFKTTLKGMGSLGSTYDHSIVAVGNKHYALFLSLGYSFRYYRFEKDLKLTKTANQIEYEIVVNPPYEFTNTFFS